jgi:hypothetical protein
MSETSPGDLAVAFRSVSRRLREALAPVHGDRSVAESEIEALDTLLTEVARSLRVEPSVQAIATACENRPADMWVDAELSALRSQAARAAALLREISRRAEDAAAARG